MNRRFLKHVATPILAGPAKCAKKGHRPRTRRFKHVDYCTRCREFIDTE